MLADSLDARRIDVIVLLRQQDDFDTGNVGIHRHQIVGQGNIVAVSRRILSVLDFRLVDFRAGFIDHHHATALAVVIEIDGDLTGDQIGGFLRVLLALAIQSDRIFQPDAIGNVKRKNRQCESSAGSMPQR